MIKSFILFLTICFAGVLSAQDNKLKLQGTWHVESILVNSESVLNHALEVESDSNFKQFTELFICGENFWFYPEAKGKNYKGKGYFKYEDNELYFVCFFPGKNYTFKIELSTDKLSLIGKEKDDPTIIYKKVKS